MAQELTQPAPEPQEPVTKPAAGELSNEQLDQIAGGTDVAVEEVIIVHEGVKRVRYSCPQGRSLRRTAMVEQ
jgi:hypothetical protein